MAVTLRSRTAYVVAALFGQYWVKRLPGDDGTVILLVL